MRAVLIALSLVAAASAARSDETWRTPAGPIVYEADRGETAILSFPMAAAFEGFGDQRASVYFPGLGGNFQDRSVHEGYWIGPGAPLCGATLTAPDGTASDVWGSARITFDAAAFPTPFTMALGVCFDAPATEIRAELP